MSDSINPKIKAIAADDCADFTPRMFAVNHSAGEKLDARVAQWLDPIEYKSVGCWYLDKNAKTELHFHDFDEYWLWIKGRTELTLRLPDGRADTFEIGPGWIVYCVRGVEHGHTPAEDWGCYQFNSVVAAEARGGHLHKNI